MRVRLRRGVANRPASQESSIRSTPRLTPPAGTLATARSAGRSQRRSPKAVRQSVRKGHFCSAGVAGKVRSLDRAERATILYDAIRGRECVRRDCTLLDIMYLIGIQVTRRRPSLNPHSPGCEDVDVRRRTRNHPLHHHVPICSYLHSTAGQRGEHAGVLSAGLVRCRHQSGCDAT